MKTRPTLMISTLLGMLVLVMFGLFRGTQSTRAESKMSVLPAAPSAVVLPTPNYTVRPGDTDGTPSGLYGNQPDCPGPGIGCDDEQWELDGNQLPSPWGEGAINVEHRFYLPPLQTDTSKLLVFLGGGNGGSRGGEYIGPIAVNLGYHVLALTYPAAQANSCSGESTAQRKRDCFGNAFREVVFGINSPNPGGDETNVGQHPQDALVNRLEKALKWAADNKPTDHGWGRYLTNTGEVDWTKVHLAGMSNGSSHGSFMGTLDEFRDVGRVSLFAGPDDGEGGDTEETWNPATYIQEAVDTGSRYYGLVHVLNKAPNDDDSVVFKVTKNWLTFGMEGPLNPGRVYFNPMPGFTPDFGAAHMLISTDPFTDYIEAHESVAHDRDCIEYGPKDEEDPNSKPDCKKWGDEPIGYEPAWRCVLGTGDSYASTKPIANAGVDQTVECQGSGGSDVVLDGSGSRDPDCDILTYAWAGSFGLASRRKPSVFLPLGMNAVTLSVRDGWWWSLFSDTAQITVADTLPPSLQVKLTPTLLWQPNHKLVRIDAMINVADSCGGSPPQVVLKSITSNQPDNGTGDGDKPNDIQEADFDTLDRSFLLRAERAGGDPNGRTYTITYTATDESGNTTQTSATVKVPHSK